MDKKSEVPNHHSDHIVAAVDNALNHAREEFERKEKQARELLLNSVTQYKNLTELEYSNSPEYYKYRMYIYSPENKEEFMAYLIVYDTINGEWKRFYSKDFWNKNDENDAGMIEIMEEMGTKATDDIAY